MKAAAVVGVRDIEVVDIPIPKVEHDGVLIKVKACGICGSDLHVYNSGLLVEDSTKQISGFSIIGHEFAGEVVEVGRDVKDFEIGDRVSSIHNKGGMAEYCEVHGDKLKNLFKMPEAVSYEAAATLEPLCNPIHSFHLRVPKDNETVAIFGLGAIGLGYLQILKTYRKSKAIAVDISKIRLDMARRLGADVVIDANRDDPVDRIKELTGSYYVRYHRKTAGGCDISVDCAGIPLTFQQSLEVLKPVGGTAIIAAIYEKSVEVDPNMILFKYMKVLGSMGYTEEEAKEGVELISQGRVNREILITHRFPLEKAAEAFSVQNDPNASIKVLILD